MSDKIHLNSVIFDDESWGDPAISIIKCPVCQFEYQHFETPEVIDGEDNYQAEWGGRGDLIVIPFWGECGHKWELCLGFHKGETFGFARLRELPPKELSQ